MEPDFILEWFHYADADLSSAEHLLTKHPQPYELICYLCEQSAEKYLKGFWYITECCNRPKRMNLTGFADCASNMTIVSMR